MNKYFVCLANSYKRGGRCVAGVEITIDQEYHWEIIRNCDGSPKWIRPIDTKTEFGEVPEDEARFIPLLSVVKLIDVSPCPHEAHSEDVHYRMMYTIGMVRPTQNVLQMLTDSIHQDIFYTKELAISPETFARGNYSLMMIHPENIQLFEDSTKKRAKYRMEFLYRGNKYDFSITDPSFYQLIAQQPELINKLKDIYLTLSIGLVYEERHHKLIAGIIIPLEEKQPEDTFIITRFGALQELSTQPFPKSEIKQIKRAFVVPSQHGLSVCIKKKSGIEKYYLLDKDSHAEIWEKVNLRDTSIVSYQDSNGEIIEKIRITHPTNNFLAIWNTIKKYL